jgi:hypothetical protein
LELFSKLPQLSEFARLVEDEVEGYNFRPLEYCPYCKEYSNIKGPLDDGKVSEHGTYIR